jgi:pimeloyl-ACP methyl ester carboxylesterase
MRVFAIPVALVLVLAVGCGTPPDAKPMRPTAVRATPFEQHDIEIGGLRLRYVDVRPQGAPAATVLLIHGHTSRIEEYDGIVPHLAARLRVLVVDLPGSGYSDKPERGYSLAFYEDALIAFLDELGVEEAYLAGGSMGGNLTLRLGHRFPQRFPRLAPWAPGSAWPARPWAAAAMRRLTSYALFWPIVKVQSRYWYSEDWPLRDATLDETFRYYDEVMGPGFVQMYFDMAADQVGRTLFDIAPEIRQPTWLGWGDRDDGANMGEGVARLHELLPDSELRVFPGARHSLAAEIPDDLGRAVAEFLLREPGV